MEKSVNSGIESLTSTSKIKRDIFEQTLTLIETMGNMVISGSLAFQLSKYQDGEAIDIGDLDLDSSGDIDIGSLGLKEHPELKSLIERAKERGVEIDNNAFYNPSLYDAVGSKLALRKLTIKSGEKQYHIRYTTPAFLLMTISARNIEAKVSNEKKRDRIRKIISSPNFSVDDYVELSYIEIDLIDKMNSGTFDAWKRILIDENTSSGKDLIELINEDKMVDNCLDKNKLILLLEAGNDLVTIDFTQIRKETESEIFLKDFMRAAN